MDELGAGVWGVAATLTVVYAAFVAMLVAHRRAGVRDRRSDGAAARWPALLRHLAATSAAGYLVFLAVVLAFSFMFADPGGAIRDAVAGGGFLWLVGLVALSAMGWAEGRIRRRGTRRT